jgi:hypothetical protein
MSWVDPNFSNVKYDAKTMYTFLKKKTVVDFIVFNKYK